VLNAKEKEGLEMRVQYVEPMLNMYPGSEDYRKIFGIRLIYVNGRQKTFCGDLEMALCAKLSKNQSAYVEKLLDDLLEGGLRNEPL